MWMSDPTLETTSSINRLRSSSTNANGTANTPPMLIQMNSGAEMSTLTKIAQLQAKLPSTAATEMALLIFFQRRVNKVMTAADPSGRSKASHGSHVLVVKFIGSSRELREWTRIIRKRHISQSRRQ